MKGITLVILSLLLTTIAANANTITTVSDVTPVTAVKNDTNVNNVAIVKNVTPVNNVTPVKNDTPVNNVTNANSDLNLPYVVEVHNDSDMVMSDSLFYAISRSIIFPVNKYDIPQNSQFVHELTTRVIPHMNARGCRLESIAIRGAASPEGPYKWNIFLGKHRLKALYDLIDKYMDEPSCRDCLKQGFVAEDYHYLLHLMRQNGDRDQERVAQLVNRYFDTNIELLKNKLMNVDGGTLWKRLLKQYFPQLRAARVVLFFKPSPTAPLSRGVALNPQCRLNLPAICQPTLPQIYLQPVTAGELVEQDSIIPRREMLAIKTNLLLDAAYVPFGYDRWCPIPNVAIEYYPRHGHFSFGASFDCPWWIGNTTNHKYFEIRNYQLEARYYLRNSDKWYETGGAAFRGLYFQGYAHLGLYQLGFNRDKGWIGEGVGAGVGLGYVLPITRNGRWRLEFSAQAGFFITKYDPFVYGCPVEKVDDGLYYYNYTGNADLFKKRQHTFKWFGPTRVGITISYDLLYRKRGGGVSTRSKERRKGVVVQ